MNKTALVIDDVQSNREHFEGILIELGIEVLLADSGESGLKILEQQSVDVIFLDYNMPPGMNGMDFIAARRELSNQETIPIIMMSTDIAINERAVSEGLAQAWVLKRATLDMVENALRDLGVMVAGKGLEPPTHGL